MWDVLRHENRIIEEKYKLKARNSSAAKQPLIPQELLCSVELVLILIYVSLVSPSISKFISHVFICLNAISTA
jgi:hypothetical protein